MQFGVSVETSLGPRTSPSTFSSSIIQFEGVNFTGNFVNEENDRHLSNLLLQVGGAILIILWQIS